MKIQGKIITPGLAYAKIHHIGHESYRIYQDFIAPEMVEFEIKKFREKKKKGLLKSFQWTLYFSSHLCIWEKQNRFFFPSEMERNLKNQRRNKWKRIEGDYSKDQ